MVTITDQKPTMPEVLALYKSVGWSMYTRDPARLERALTYSLMVLGAYEGKQLVGLIRAVGDGETILFIQDLLVLPEYQRRGIGKQLIEALLARFPEVRQRVLLTDDDPKTRSFYKAAGFVESQQVGVIAFYHDQH
ncbi:MAG: GNAT family N-acetyltransferase [Lacticaseibacillus paracasei]|jgi:GNAT superfamily N-acetyltransferase|uniref:GNAT family N-acetyltransferase n=1 Tax=Lacticaseibacillus paracasei TaxID=1597 RepID=UPI000D7050AC|nr:GNAT family N-acetyltransferase [Lacticaseibacillus paracasei]AWN84349.1 GNAT family N-acetyltransferase [Lacticaseibacillus paracasei]MCL4175554.1 GNAT family N-acetyltransferase [Lacticaseibacillus paracasei]MDE3305006.1 GNAT family N-acetyltransferase [Lacticaseibacillus paracasei]MDN6006438.1 GNAT family N-acetyltransferase [Lacticaseibacillus paracasei]MDN6433995.1 GNAT family N-acetyltransferase [Lacticaseibacillus paracasei]